MMWELPLVLDSCPACHRPFALVQVSKEPVDSSTEDMLKEPPRMASGRYTPIVNPTPVEFVTTYKIVYRCKHCGKEWSKTETEEREVDRKNAGPEQASEADVAREAEEAREEQQAERY